MQYPSGAVESSIPVKNGELELFAMSKGGLDKTKLKRVVFVIHGEVRLRCVGGLGEAITLTALACSDHRDVTLGTTTTT